MTSISSASAGNYQSPLQRLQQELQSEVSAGTISSSDESALSTALNDIDSAIQQSRSGDSSSGTSSSPGDVKSKIDDIATKYIRPDEGTFDFAFMYVPVESVYYELACNPAAGLLEYANERRVFPVSPNTFTAYLQLIVLGMRSMQVE